jgi:DNA mismatch endonuclease (patch repair protein)
VTDVFDQITRSRIMKSVRSKNTKPEIRLRKALFSQGVRYRLHASALPGTLDLVFPGRKAVLFVHGCYWHWHGCKRSQMPATNRKFWERKIARNMQRDLEHAAALYAQGWRVIVVWECAIKLREMPSTVADVVSWLRGEEMTLSLPRICPPTVKT